MRGEFKYIIASILLLGFVCGQEILPLDEPYAWNDRNNDALRYEITMSWLSDLDVNVNFGGWTGDYFFEYFLPPCPGVIERIDFEMSDLPDVSGGSMSVAIFRINYGWDEIDEEVLADACGDANLGYYPGVTEFFDIEGDIWIPGGINAVEGANPDFEYNPLMEKVWPVIDYATVPLEPNGQDGGTISLDLVATMGHSWEFGEEEPFAVVVRFNGFPAAGDADHTRTGFMTGQFSFELPPSLKFYNIVSSPEGRCGFDDWGWYIRSYIWDWKVVADISCPPPFIWDFTLLGTTTDTGPRTVEATFYDENPGGVDPADIRAWLYYAVNDGNFESIDMVYAEGDTWTADVPGQLPGTHVDYYLIAEMHGLTHESPIHGYDIFQVTSPFLFLYDASAHPFATSLMYPNFYGYNAPATDSVQWDTWDGQAFGDYELDLLSHYRLIYYVTGFYPANEPDLQILNDWMQQAGPENPRFLFLTGQDVGMVSGFADTTFPPGSFMYDYLGVDHLGPQDIVGGTTDLYAIDAVDGDPLSGYLTSLNGQLYYDPAQLDGTNWVDHMTMTEHGIAWLTDPNNGDHPLAVRAEGVHWKTAYTQIDPYCMVYDDPVSGITNVTDNVMNIWNEVFEWFDPDFVSVDEGDLQQPAGFYLGPAFPNPFNGEVQLELQIPERIHVLVRLYDIAGRTVETLLDEELSAGVHSLEWRDHDEHAAGMYLLRVSSGDFRTTRKIVLLK